MRRVAANRHLLICRLGSCPVRRDLPGYAFFSASKRRHRPVPARRQNMAKNNIARIFFCARQVRFGAVFLDGFFVSGRYDPKKKSRPATILMALDGFDEFGAYPPEPSRLQQGMRHGRKGCPVDQWRITAGGAKKKRTAECRPIIEHGRHKYASKYTRYGSPTQEGAVGDPLSGIQTVPR